MAKRKATITLSEAVLAEVDRLAGKGGNRSEIIESAVIHYLDARRRSQRDARDRAIIDDNAASLNAEAADALSYQVGW